MSKQNVLQLWYQRFAESDDIRIEKVFSRISKELIRQLYEEVFKIDFEMFEIPFPEKYIDMGR